MTWCILEYPKSDVDRAGRMLATCDGSPDDINHALEVLNNWRAAHGFPLNTLQMTLRNLARQAHERPLIAQRLKRVPSIVGKLQRFPTMNLSRMQDIGGCRAVLESVSHVRTLRAAYGRSRQKHALVSEKDYITEPKSSGYRSVHLVYRYSSQRNPEHNGRLIEIQLRSRFQHAWATAVETMGTFLQQSLKSSQGSEQWLDFFSLTGSAFALMESTPPVPGTPTDRRALRDEIVALESELDTRRILRAYGQALRITEDSGMKGAYYFLLSLLPAQGKLTVYGFPKDQLTAATRQYLVIEKQQVGVPGAQAVLVASDSISALKRAYPNYFLDTQVFVSTLKRFTDQKRV